MHSCIILNYFFMLHSLLTTINYYKSFDKSPNKLSVKTSTHIINFKKYNYNEYKLV